MVEKGAEEKVEYNADPFFCEANNRRGLSLKSNIQTMSVNLAVTITDLSRKAKPNRWNAARGDKIYLGCLIPGLFLAAVRRRRKEVSSARFLNGHGGRGLALKAGHGVRKQRPKLFAPRWFVKKSVLLLGHKLVQHRLSHHLRVPSVAVAAPVPLPSLRSRRPPPYEDEAAVVVVHMVSRLDGVGQQLAAEALRRVNPRSRRVTALGHLKLR